MCLHENHFKLLILALSTLCHCQLLFVVFFSSRKAASSCGLRLSWNCACPCPSATLLLAFLAASHVACSLCFSLRVALLLLNFFPRHFLKLAFSVRRAGFTHTHTRTPTHPSRLSCLFGCLSRYGLVTQWVHSPTRCPAVCGCHIGYDSATLLLLLLSFCRVSLTWLACLSNCLSLCFSLTSPSFSRSRSRSVSACEKCCQYLLLHRCICLSTYICDSVCVCVCHERMYVYVVCVCMLQPLTFRLLNDSTISANEIFLQRI